MVSDLTYEYAWQIINADVEPFGSKRGWGLVANNLTATAMHLEGRGYEILSMQPVSDVFGFIFYRRVKEMTIGVTRDDVYFDGDSTPIREAASEINIYAIQDDCLIAIQDRRPIPDALLRQLPPWRAVMIARIGAQAGVRMECGSLAELEAEAARVGGAGKLAATYEEARK